MEKILCYFTSLHLVHRNRKWWQSDLPAGTKISYYSRVVESAIRLLVSGRKEVRYLGRRFRFDNPATLLNLQVYPYEVSRMILRHISDPPSVRTILDIGGNIGQFAATAGYFLPQAEIDVLEPNPHALTYLRSNLEGAANTRIHPYALSSQPSANLYFEPNRTCTGSFFADNVGMIWKSTKIPIETRDDVVAITGRRHYDLVKVDVESAEFEAIKCLRGITVTYMFVELSTANRTQPYLHSQMFELLQDLFGDYDILAQDELTEEMNNFDLMIKFTGKRVAAPV